MFIKKEMVHKMWKQEFSCSECSLNHQTPEDFTRCFWQKEERVEPSWLVYRTVIALYFIVTWITSVLNVGRHIKDEDVGKYPIFLTNWTYTLETFMFTLALIMVAKRAAKEKKPDFNPEEVVVKMPWYYKLYWVLHTIVLSASISVTVIFWTAVYDPEFNELDFINITTHAFNSVFMIIDFFLVAHPFRITHVYLPIIYAASYVTFTLVYQLSGGTGTEGKTPIYGILNWEKPLPTITTCLLAQLFIMTIHTLFWLLYKAKVVTKKNRSNSSGGKVEKKGFENHGMDMRIV